MALLDQIKQPHDVSQLSADELERLAEEIRRRIIDAVSHNGGHLAPPLGTVELTIALHAVFESPQDRIIWDVGHQAYAHKLLTGRADAFPSIRRKGGLSGYLRRSESAHDFFGAGHASTAIAAGVGMAKARDLQGGHERVVAVVGDGAMTGGLAYEALNNLGHLETPMIVVLNDNSMSISPNVGSMSRYLARLRAAPSFGRLKKAVQRTLRHLPLVGAPLVGAAGKLKEAIKLTLVPDAGAFFEELGVKYFGPFDGHDIPSLVAVFELVKDTEVPVLVHVVTRKGKGYPFAEEEPGKWHGASPFDPSTGKGTGQKSPPKWQDAFGEILVRVAKEDPRVVAITAAMSDGTGLNAFARELPERFFDVGIAEAYAVTFAGGLATRGMRPVAAIYSTFLQRAYDQIIHDIAIQELPVLFCMDRAGLVGEDGATHQGLYDLAYLRCIPNMTIAVPRDRESLETLIRGALQVDGPVALRYPRGEAASQVGGAAQALPWGAGEVLREGQGVAILALGPMVELALEAREMLMTEGVQVTVADGRFVKPLDARLIRDLAGRHDLLFTVEEGTAMGGFGSAVLELVAAERLDCQVRIWGTPDRMIEHGSRQENLEEVGLTARALAQAISQALGSARHAS